MTVLLIEDDVIQRTVMSELLDVVGYPNETAQSTAEARRMLREADYDAVVTDYDLGDGHAGQLFDEDLLDPARTIMLSAHSRARAPSNTVRLTKPVDMDRFFKALEGIIGALDATPSDEFAAMVVDDADPADPAVGNGATAGSAGPPDIDLVLYTSRRSLASRAAQRNLTAALGTLCRQVSLRVIDLAVTPPGSPGVDDDIVFTPTLVRCRPGPRAVLVGDLSDRDLLLAVLTGDLR